MAGKAEPVSNVDVVAMVDAAPVGRSLIWIVLVCGLAATIDGFDSTKGGIRFTDERPLPDAAIDALVTGRRDEIDAALARR